MVWARICHDGRTLLIIVQGTLNVVIYRDDILDPIVRPFLQQRNLITTFNIAMQDVTWLVFAKTFWTRITPVFVLGRHYQRICHQLNVYGMNSVDVFATVKIHRKHYSSCVTHEWNNIPKAFIQQLIGSMRRRCEAVVTTRGGHTCYWTPQTSILHDNFCLSMICSNNDFEKCCWYFLICYDHINLN